MNGYGVEPLLHTIDELVIGAIMKRTSMRVSKESWQGLMKGSDCVRGKCAPLIGYGNTAAGYSAAALHVAALRAARISYRIRRRNDPVYPFELVLKTEQWQRGHDLLELAGIGADLHMESPPAEQREIRMSSSGA